MAARTKRVSMKGRGADIFFGEYEAPAPAAARGPEGAAEQPQDAAAVLPTPPADPTGGDPDSAPEDTATPTDAAPDRPAVEPAALSGAAGASDPQGEGAEAQQPSKRASKQALAGGTPEPAQPWSAPLDPAVLDATWPNVARQATLANTFRYTDEELTWLNDALYDLTTRHRVKLTKQDIARLGLNAVLWDYQVHGDASLLGELVRRKRRP